MTKDNFQWLKWISEIQAIAQSGLTYTTNEYDKERYIRLREIVFGHWFLPDSCR